jgi:hypothetical protein
MDKIAKTASRVRFIDIYGHCSNISVMITKHTNITACKCGGVKPVNVITIGIFHTVS